MKGVMKKILSESAPRPVGEVLHENEGVTAEEALEALRKECRKILKSSGQWHQDFHKSEIAAVMAMFMATKDQLDKKEQALGVAIGFIGSVDDYDKQGHITLEKINQILVGESIDQSIQKQG